MASTIFGAVGLLTPMAFFVPTQGNMKTEKITSQFAARSSSPAETKTINLNDRLALIALIDESARLGFADTPIASDLFNDLWELVNATVSGSRIDRFKPEEVRNGFRKFEINAETGESLGRLKCIC